MKFALLLLAASALRLQDDAGTPPVADVVKNVQQPHELQVLFSQLETQRGDVVAQMKALKDQRKENEDAATQAQADIAKANLAIEGLKKRVVELDGEKAEVLAKIGKLEDKIKGLEAQKGLAEHNVKEIDAALAGPANGGDYEYAAYEHPAEGTAVQYWSGYHNG